MTNHLISELRFRIRSFYFFILLSLISFSAFAQTTTVTGTVTDETGPLPGVTVLLKGTSNGVVTDFDGDYEITDVPANGVLVFSYVGFVTEEMSVNGQSEINVTLIPDVSTLDEVVVVGYGSMKRSDVTGAMVSIASESIEEAVPTTIDQVLQGRAAGVQIQQNSGAPGASSSIRIRGISSITGSNEPIFVIDGVIIDSNTGQGGQNAFASINPSDIASIEILKDASATAIYGSRAANGVIIITTKRGQAGEMRVNFDSSIGFQELPNRLDLLNLQEYAIHRNTRADLGIVEQDPYFIRPDLLGEGTDWQEEMFTRAQRESYNLSVSGGNEKSSYSMSMGYLEQEGIALGSSFDRLNLRGLFDTQVKEYLKTGINFAFSEIDQNTTFSDASLILTALRQTPNVAVRNAEGTFDGPVTDEFVQTNPVGLASIRTNRNENINLRANTYAELEMLEGLTLRSEYSMDYGFQNGYTFNPSYTFGAIVNPTREGSRTKGYSKNYSIRNVLTFDRTFGNHSINAILGQEFQENFYENLYGYRTGYLTNGATDLNLGDPLTARNSNFSSRSALSSYFTRAFYSFDDRYLLTATLRYDGSSQFSEENRWGWFPSAALAWRISNEEFLTDNDYINNLKLRLGYGAVGNQSAPNYAYTSVYAASATPFGTGLLAANTANPDLQWETTYSTNLGLDLNMFNNRLEFIADVYYKKTDNLLLAAPYPDYSGTTGIGSTAPPIVNIGALENKGLELTLNTVNVDDGNFAWSSNLVFTLNRNEVLALATETGIINQTLQQGSDITIVTRTTVGKPIAQFYGYQVIGRFEEATDFYYRNEAGDIVPTALPEDMEIGENGVWIGDYIFKDVNNDGVINEQDRDYIGNPHPDFTFGIGNSFRYKNFDLNVQLSGVYGNEVVNYQRRFLENPRESTNLLQSALGYAELGLIDPAGPVDYRNVAVIGGDPFMPRIAASSAASASNFRFSDRFLEDGSYLRVQNISFGYRFPVDWIERFRLDNLKVYTNLQNVYTFTNYSGFDPEIGAINQNVLLTGIDNGRYPSPRIYTVGVNLTF
ncbi:SusC/RagA family TonB-linked outer membrane protein [Salinimicrobium terrae]|uniref:SusC/RagA family TonB-linked outer membrane protein n=1 Tax=Salinimicrobium terrae TaxID=470866 RepID=UPI0004294C99|nr:TonB-dependent receptor [Salinimicrobium terrae]